MRDLEKRLEQAWCKETSSDPNNWTAGNPAWGQCAVTSLVVNDYLGGRLIWASASLPDGSESSHYFNETATGQIVDLTKRQFPQGTIIPQGIDKKKQYDSTREYVLSFEQTRNRYELLKEKISGDAGI